MKNLLLLRMPREDKPVSGSLEPTKQSPKYLNQSFLNANESPKPLLQMQILGFLAKMEA